MAELALEGVWKRYKDGTEAIKNLDLSVDDGEFVVLVGPSGCGKSTVLRMVAGLEEISAGHVRIGRRVVNDLTPRDRDIAMVFQSYALYPHMSVGENMGFALKLAKKRKPEIAERVRGAADILGLTEQLLRKPRALSGGQRQRVAMGRAIVRSPQAFLLDEPLSNLDAKLRVQMRAEITQLQNRLNVTTLYVTHDQVEAMTMGDRVAVLKRGVLQQVASPQTLYDLPTNVFVAGFIGSPAMNVVQGRLDRQEGRLIAHIGSTTLSIPDEAIDVYSKVPEWIGKDVAFGLRPEHFRLADGDVPSHERFKVQAELVEALGSDLLLHFKVDAPPIASEDIREAVDDDDVFAKIQQEAREGGSTFTARLDPSTRPRVGEWVEVAFRSAKLHFFDLQSGTALR